MGFGLAIHPRTERVDYLLLLKLVEQLFPDPRDRSKLFWDTPSRLFGFGHQTGA